MSKVRGAAQRSALARALRCQPTFISQVLNGATDFNLEQAVKIGEFLGLSPEEQHFFLLLIQTARAGTAELRKYFEGQTQTILEKRMILTERLEKRARLSVEQQSVYYSSWRDFDTLNYKLVGIMKEVG